MKVLGYTFRFASHLHPFVPVLAELRERGHEVVLAVCTDGPDIPQLLGLDVRKIDWDADAQLPAVDPAELPRTPHEREILRRYVTRGESLAAALEALIRAERPDCLLVDAMHWGGAIAAEASGLPWAIRASDPMDFRALGPDPRGPGLRPPRTPFGRLWHRFVEAGLAAMDEPVLPVVNDVRTRRGLPPLAHPWDSYFRAPLILASTAEPFEYPRDDWPAALRFVGPIVWDRPAENAPVLDSADGRPLILLTGSSVNEEGAAREWIDVALAALADEPYQVLATVPSGKLPANVPANARVERFLSHAAVLPHAACVVCHGGAGITHKALAAGVPVVAIPFALDRFEVARRVEVARAGVRLLGSRLTPARLRAAVRRAIRMRTGAVRIAEAFARAGGAPAAADAIDSLMSSSYSLPYHSR